MTRWPPENCFICALLPNFWRWLQNKGIFRDEEPAMIEPSVRRELMQGLETSMGEIV